MDLKLIFLWLSLILFLFHITAFFHILMSYPDIWYLLELSLHPISFFFIYFFVKDYEKIKEYLSDFQYKTTSHLLHKNRNQTVDLIKLSIISILIVLLIDVTLTKISEQSFLDHLIGLLGLIPWLQGMLEKMITEKYILN